MFPRLLLNHSLLGKGRMPRLYQTTLMPSQAFYYERNYSAYSPMGSLHHIPGGSYFPLLDLVILDSREVIKESQY
jgi:hypothetical protein